MTAPTTAKYSQSQKVNFGFSSTDETLINGNSHALVKITATYTFGFGKKVGHDNEPRISGTAASGILK